MITRSVDTLEKCSPRLVLASSEVAESERTLAIAIAIVKSLPSTYLQLEPA